MWAIGSLAAVVSPVKTIFSVDGGFAAHELAGFAARHQSRLTLASKFLPDAVLPGRPPVKQPGQNGRPRVVGTRLPSPKDAMVDSSSNRQRLAVKWYAGGMRRFERGTGHWYRQRLVPVRWI